MNGAPALLRVAPVVPAHAPRTSLKSLTKKADLADCRIRKWIPATIFLALISAVPTGATGPAVPLPAEAKVANIASTSKPSSQKLAQTRVDKRDSATISPVLLTVNWNGQSGQDAVRNLTSATLDPKLVTSKSKSPLRGLVKSVVTSM